MKLLVTHVFIVFALLVSRPSSAAPLSFSFADPVGDGNARVDIVGLDFSFDNATGAYEIVYEADAAKPFLGQFRLNVNLFNPDTGSTAEVPSYFADTLNNFNIATATTFITLTGTNSRLLSWEAGDRVAARGPDPLGLPDPDPSGITAFQTEVLDLPAPIGSVPGQDEFGPVYAHIVPLPGALVLLFGALGGMAVVRWRRRS